MDLIAQAHDVAPNNKKSSPMTQSTENPSISISNIISETFVSR